MIKQVHELDIDKMDKDYNDSLKLINNDISILQNFDNCYSEKTQSETKSIN
jgi:hypothetical protein